MSIISPADTSWMIRSGISIIAMQIGFALLESGAVRNANTAHVMVKNLSDLTLGVLMYWAIGFAFYHGTGNPFMGTTEFFLSGTTEYLTFFFHFSFAATAATIDGGAVAERFDFWCYLALSMFTTGVVYPVVAHWQWNADGWLVEMGFLDFAGSNVVHFLGGVSAFVACRMVGPRISVQRMRRYSMIEDNDERVQKLLQQQLSNESTPMHVLFGSFMLAIGWLSFNCGSMTTIEGSEEQIGLIAANTLLGAAAGSVATSAFSAWRFKGVTKIEYICNGMLGGLVAVTANCDATETWAAVVIGAFTPLFLELGDWLNLKFDVDDVISAVPVHGMCGIWGVIATGIFHTQKGVLYGGNIRFLFVQCLGLIATLVWSASLTYAFIWVMNKVRPIRVDPAHEESGADCREHGIINVITLPKLFEKNHIVTLSHDIVEKSNIEMNDDADEAPAVDENKPRKPRRRLSYAQRSQAKSTNNELAEIIRERAITLSSSLESAEVDVRKIIKQRQRQMSLSTGIMSGI